MTEIEIIKKLKSALEEIKSAAENHPAFKGYEEDGISRDAVDAEGGDCAFVTIDIAWVAKSALSGEALQGLIDYTAKLERELRRAIRQNECDMILTGEELRRCHAVLRLNPKGKG